MFYFEANHEKDKALPCLIAGLGNPGREYRKNRHNIGFMAIDALAESLGVRMMRVQSKAIIGTGTYMEQKIVLAKPQTFMNLSGEAVSALVRFYKVPFERLLVVHDDIDLPAGTLRLRPGGGTGGQKGIASIIQKTGTQNFPRLRLGVGRPPGQMDAAAYVLQDFSGAEEILVKLMLDRAVKAMQCYLEQGLEQAMNQFNGGLEQDLPR